MLSSFLLLIAYNLEAQPYRVQLAAFNERVTDDYFFNLDINQAYLRKDRNDIYRYFQGDFLTEEDANNSRRDALLKGFKYARVINIARQQQMCDNSSCPIYQSRRNMLNKVTPELYLKSIFFDFNQRKLNKASRKELDNLVKIHRQNPTLNIQILGHADALGSKEYNLHLSKERARAAKDYLLRKGVSIKHIKIKAFGESVPVAINQQEDGNDEPTGRSFNRRVVLALVDPRGGIVYEESEFREVPTHLKINQETPPELLIHALMQN